MKNDIVSTNRQKKEKIVAEISQHAKIAKAFIFTDYQGMTHKQIEDLKKQLKTQQANLVVTKNTLLNRVLESIGYKLDDASLHNPTATIFAYSDDFLTPLKTLTKMIKNLKMPIIKAGIFEGKIITALEVMKLSTIPSREILIAQMVRGIKSPIFGLHRALNWNLQKLVLTLNAIQKSKTQ